jgi:GT2 family glycosyltransferase
MPPLELSVVIVSYNTREMTLRCLRELTDGLGGVSAEVFLVDNASTDGSVEAIRRDFPDVRIIANAANAGFGAANNQAMARAAGEFVLLLNSDAFPRPGAIQALVRYLKSHADVGVVGPRLLNADGSLQRSCYRFPSPLRAWAENLWLSAALPNHRVFGDYSRWPHDRERQVEWVVGACMLVRREVVAQTGGFDERFFMYSEEADWQKRIRKAGWSVAFTPASKVVHLGGASGAAERSRINRHFFESLDYYERKHHGALGLVSLRAAMVVGCSLRAILWLAAAACVRSRRQVALAKLRMHAWLVARQLTHWRLDVGRA